VLIVGAGPAGSTCALALRKRDVAEVVVLDKSTYPRVKVCGSGLSPLALGILDQLEMRERFRPRHAVLAALRAKGPDGHVVQLAAGEGAWVVPRSDFDHGLVSEAERLGARFEQDTKVTSLLRDDRGAVRGVQTNRGEFEADVVVCADGAPSRFSPDSTPKTTIRTLMGWWKGAQIANDVCVLIWDRRLDGYYAWAFPEPDGVTNIGLTIPETSPDANRLKELFQEILDEHFGAELRGAEPTRKWMGHPAVITTRMGPVADARALWIGEAARLVMPGTAEGIGFAMESGVHGADHIARHYDHAAGFAPSAREGFRKTAARRVLPKFWAGEAFVRGMRSRRARAVGAMLLSPGVQRAVAKGIASLLGETG
jgi:flavin-dependent dehydrogenase